MEKPGFRAESQTGWKSSLPFVNWRHFPLGTILERQLQLCHWRPHSVLYRHSLEMWFPIFMEDLGKAARSSAQMQDFPLLRAWGLVTEESHMLCSTCGNLGEKGLSVTDLQPLVGVCPGVQLLRPTWVRDNTQAGLHQEWRIFCLWLFFIFPYWKPTWRFLLYLLVLRFLECS